MPRSPELLFRPITPKMIKHFASNHIPFYLSCILSVLEAIKICICILSDVDCQSLRSFVDCLLVFMVQSHFQYCCLSISKIHLDNGNIYSINNIDFLTCKTCKYHIWELCVLLFAVFDEWAIIGTSPFWCFLQTFLNSYWVKHATKTCNHFNKISTILHCYELAFCSNLIFCPVGLRIFSVFQSCWTRYHTAHMHLGWQSGCKQTYFEAWLWFRDNMGLSRWLNRLQYQLSIEIIIDDLRQSKCWVKTQNRFDRSAAMVSLNIYKWGSH